MPSKWKMQREYPNTCTLTEIVRNWVDPIEGPKSESMWVGCIYIEIYDVLVTPHVISVAAVERVCDAHVTVNNPVNGKLLWQDGNYKDKDRYIRYQQEWFLNLLVRQWNAKKAAGIIPANEPLMEELLPFRVEPTTPGSISAPPAGEISDRERLYNWNIEHNARLGDTYEIIQTETLERDTQALATHAWTLAGDSRLLTVNPNQGLNTNITARIQADCDVQFGPGKVVIES